MTVVVGFVSPKYKTCFLGSDDLRGPRPKRDSKVEWFINRLAVGGIGVTTVMDAAHLAELWATVPTVLRGGETYKPPSTLAEFADLVASLLPPMAVAGAKAMREAVECEERTEKEAGRSLNQNGRLVIIEPSQYRMALVSYGKVFPPRENYSFDFRDFPHEQAFRFGIDEPTCLGAVTYEIVDHPFRWCGAMVAQARALCVRHGVLNAVGERGSCVLVKNGKVKVMTAFESLHDFVRRRYDP